MPPVGDNQDNQNNFNNNMPPVNNNLNQNSQMSVDDGKGISIVGLILAFFFPLIGLILSIIGLSKAKKSNSQKALPITGIILSVITMLFSTIFGILLIIGITKKSSDTTKNIDTYQSSTDDEYNKDNSNNNSNSSISAEDLSDYNKVCTNGYKVSNATAYEPGKPSKVVIVYNTKNSENYYYNITPSKTSWAVDYESPSTAQLVACMNFSDSIDANKNCDYTTNGEKVSIQLYHSKYRVELYEAKTYKKIGSTTITTSGNECPSYVSYDKNNPKVYQKPIAEDLEGFLTTYVE